ncbi:MAG: sensor histidine kinase N-terminal domain-containing protein [Rhodocyclaceae bacterium]|nr:sensor histidine kinase N-terminal domain-containing protein [Rhodocyclaceae bacterium]
MSAPASSPSLRLRLLAGALAAIAATWIALSFVAWRESIHEADELFDAHLAQTAMVVAGFVGDEADEIAQHLPSHRYARKVAFQIWGNDRLLAHSAEAPEERLSAAEQGFSDATSGGRAWRVYSLRDESGHYLIQVAETHDARQALGRELAVHLVEPLALALPVLALALVLLIRANLAPLARLAESIGERSPDRLEAIPLAGTVRELHPILAQLNRLFERLHRSIDQERRFTADAAHELRTPLAAMRAHAQVARASTDIAERERALDKVVEASDRATHLIEQLLTLARLDAASLGGSFVACDLQQLAAAALAQAAPFALSKHVEPSLTEGPAKSVRGEPTLLSVLLRNLIDNAVRYSPPDSRLRVAVDTTAEGGVQLDVVDQGPGIPAADRQRVLDRFTRIDASGESGSGLGLSIVARIAELHAARLELSEGEDGRGLRVRLAFPPAEKPYLSA